MKYQFAKIQTAFVVDVAEQYNELCDIKRRLNADKVNIDEIVEEMENDGDWSVGCNVNTGMWNACVAVVFLIWQNKAEGILLTECFKSKMHLLFAFSKFAEQQYFSGISYSSGNVNI